MADSTNLDHERLLNKSGEPGLTNSRADNIDAGQAMPKARDEELK